VIGFFSGPGTGLFVGVRAVCGDICLQMHQELMVVWVLRRSGATVVRSSMFYRRSATISTNWLREVHCQLRARTIPLISLIVHSQAT